MYELGSWDLALMVHLLPFGMAAWWPKRFSPSNCQHKNRGGGGVTDYVMVHYAGRGLGSNSNREWVLVCGGEFNCKLKQGFFF